MPIDEIEYHPYLQVGEAIQISRMIVGTFPIYSLTNPRKERKNQLQDQRNDLSFFMEAGQIVYGTGTDDMLILLLIFKIRFP